MRLPFFSSRQPPAIRPLHPEDAPAVSAIHAEGFNRAWGPEEVIPMLLDAAVTGHGIGPSRGRLQGFILSRRAADEAEILTIAVAKKDRGAGLAGRLLRAHLGRLAAQGVRTLFLEVDEDNAPARRLYDRLGFTEVGRRVGYYRRPDGTQATALVMRLPLD
jgi:ribosomal-protein-alanine N-acetyltransferase